MIENPCVCKYTKITTNIYQKALNDNNAITISTRAFVSRFSILPSNLETGNKSYPSVLHKVDEDGNHCNVTIELLLQILNL